MFCDSDHTKDEQCVASQRQLVSILCPSYNHEQYVARFLNSVIAQNCADWELIIIDDGSSDDNCNQIAKFKDARIKFLQNDYNRGINVTLNKAFSLSIGDYVAFAASDDMMMPNYVDAVIDAFMQHPDCGVVYTPLQVVDDSDRPTGVVYHAPRHLDRRDYFAELFLRRNFLQSPGMAIRRQFANEVFPLPVGFLQFQDVALSMMLMSKTFACHLERPVVMYREARQGISAMSASQLSQQVAETSEFMDLAIDMIGTNVDKLRSLFRNERMIQDVEIPPTLVSFWLARIAMTSDLDARRTWGISHIYKLLTSDNLLDRLHSTYGWEFRDLYKVIRDASPIAFTMSAICHEVENRMRLIPFVWKVKKGKARYIHIFNLRIQYR